MPKSEKPEKASKPEKPAKPEKPTKSEKSSRPDKPSRASSKRNDLDDHDDIDDKGPTSRALTKVKPDASVNLDKRQIAKLKEKPRKELTEEERSLLRKYRRAKELKKKLAGKGADGGDEEGERDAAAPEPPMAINANLSNQNNITIHNTGVEEIAKTMERMMNMLVETTDRATELERQLAKDKTKEKEVTETATKEKSTTKKVGSEKERKKLKSAPSDDDTESEPENVGKSLVKMLSTKSSKVSEFEDKYTNETSISKTSFQRQVSRLHTFTSTTLRKIIKSSDDNFADIFWWLLCCSIPELRTLVVHFFTYLTMWFHDLVEDEWFAKSLIMAFEEMLRQPIGRLPDMAPRVEALKWFVTEYESSQEFLLWLKYVWHPQTHIPTRYWVNGANRCVTVDPYGIVHEAEILSLLNLVAQQYDIDDY